MSLARSIEPKVVELRTGLRALPHQPYVNGRTKGRLSARLFTMLMVEIQFSDCERVYNVEPKKIMTSDQCQTVTVMGSLGHGELDLDQFLNGTKLISYNYNYPGCQKELQYSTSTYKYYK